ncbi:MAG: penicillin-binding transpeptidase domain-containing protein [Planctomycetota bacterium]
MILKRLHVLGWIFAILMSLVEAQLVHLQFGTREFWESEARASRIGGQPVPFQRGGIYDRYGRPLAEGETVNRLIMTYQQFRKETVIGQLIGGGRLLADISGRPAPRVRDVLERPTAWIRLVLGAEASELSALTDREAADYGFYARNLLAMDEAPFRSLMEESEERGMSYLELVPGCLEKVYVGVEEQASALRDLAASVDLEHAEFIDLLDRAIQEVRDAAQRTIERFAVAPTPSQRAAIFKDHESRPRVLSGAVSYQTVFLVNLVPERFVGCEVVDVTRRSYPERAQDISPALIGWVGFPTDEMLGLAEDDSQRYQELRSRPPEEIDGETAEHIDWLRQQIRHYDYRADEEQGRAGLEALLEPVLRGKRGWRIVERDSAKQDTRLLEMTPPQNGQDVRLTLDLDLQRACERVLAKNGQNGAIVLLDPRDGAIRAMATWPNPTRQQIRKDYADLLKDPDWPLHQRAYRPPGNAPPPGSVFKVVATAAALEAGVITPATTFNCQHYYQVGQTPLKCMGSHGEIDLVTALKKSCNIYFYELSRHLPLKLVLGMAQRFGLGQASGFGDAERLGLPAPARSIGELDCPFQTGSGVTFGMRTLIGHGAIDDVTPLQIATMMAPFANGGMRVRPFLIDAIGGRRAPRDAPVSIGLKADTVATVRKGMIAATEEDGTAQPRGGYDLRPFRVAAKTGTSQDASRVDHAWIAGFFPYDQPEFSFAVFLEHVGKGGGAAGTPVLGELLSQPELKR